MSATSAYRSRVVISSDSPDGIARGFSGGSLNRLASIDSAALASSADSSRPVSPGGGGAGEDAGRGGGRCTARSTRRIASVSTCGGG